MQTDTNCISETTNNFYLESLGCAKNSVDSEVFITLLKNYGLNYVKDAKDANFIIINSCGFIDSAKQESIDVTISAYENFKKAKIILTGCLAERYGETLKEILPEASFIVGNKSINDSAEKIANYIFSQKTDELQLNKFVKRFDRFTTPRTAYLKIAEGCDNCCTFCAIPLIRGNIKSRTIDEIYSEFKWLIENQNIFEVNLVAQDLCSFGKDRGKVEFIELLEKLLTLPGDYIVRMLYIHPDHFDERILELCKKDSRLLPYFDIPFQSASKAVVENMNRKKSDKQLLEIVNTIRKELPNSVIRSTIMCGFPNETEEDFLITKNFLQEAKLDWVGFFIYSKEEGTKADTFITDKDYKKSIKIAEKRKKILEDIQEEIMMENLLKHVGKTYRVLIENCEQDEYYTVGRTYFQAPEVDGTTLIKSDKKLSPGDVVNVKIIKTFETEIEGELV